MCVYIYIYIYVYLHVYLYVNVQTCRYMFVHVYSAERATTSQRPGREGERAQSQRNEILTKLKADLLDVKASTSTIRRAKTEIIQAVANGLSQMDHSVSSRLELSAPSNPESESPRVKRAKTDPPYGAFTVGYCQPPE